MKSTQQILEEIDRRLRIELDFKENSAHDVLRANCSHGADLLISIKTWITKEQ